MIHQNYLSEKAFSKIGRVYEIKGRNVIIKVENHIGKTNLFHNGEIYRNISIGSLIKIEKDFMVILGKIEREYLRENTRFENNKSVTKEDRFLEVTIIGNIQDGNLNKGISELPNLHNEAFILSENDMNKIYDINEKFSISLGNSVFENINIKVGISKLFASHIGIFGNTGSGKSNTLSYLLNQLFNNIKADANRNSKFILLDFNGEYTNDSSIITNNKFNIKLSTRDERLDEKLSVKAEWLDEEFWGIFLQATEKTQKPFIKRTLNLMNKLQKNSREDTLSYVCNIICNIFREFLSTSLASEKDEEIIKMLKKTVYDFYKNNITDHFIFNCRDYNITSNKKIYREQVDEDNPDDIFNSNIYFNKNELIENEVKSLKEELTSLGLIEFKYTDLFQLAMNIRIIYDLKNSISQYEYLTPLLNRFSKRKREIEMILDISDSGFVRSDDDKLLYSISLKDLNTEMKKLVPLLIVKKIYDDHKSGQFTGLHTLHIIIDEAHNILSEDSNRENQAWKDYRLEVFEEVVKEGRKYGVFLILASQRPSDISSTVISQLHNLFIHRLVNEMDLRAISRSVSYIDKLSFDSLPIISAGNAIFTGTATESPILVKIPILNDRLQPKSQTINLDSIWLNI